MAVQREENYHQICVLYVFVVILESLDLVVVWPFHFFLKLHFQYFDTDPQMEDLAVCPAGAGHYL